ncbi:MAG: hypothetical protein OEY20_17085 [Gemmatimonadota bacterium]|nr:hypothetical protein [Gemmatimonadota bacterium]MDH5198959.1 hypothetical protein [Gemmatimonadota bacterium]
MSSLRNIFAAASLGSILLGCAEGAGPLATGENVAASPTGAMSEARNGNRTTAPTDGLVADTTTITLAPSGAPAPLRFLPDAPRLRTYDTTFVAHQGWKQSFVIFHEDGNYFMVLDVPASAQFVDADGNPVPDGAEVELRARVDSASVSFEFGPHGSYFTGSRPVLLWVYLKYVDVGSSGGLPNIWYQADATLPWAVLPTTADRAGNWLKVELRHFSNYAVAY